MKIHSLLAAVCLMLPAVCRAQEEGIRPEMKENPRGVYKLMGILDKYDTTIKEPFDQYKICTDSVTLMLVVNGNRFSLQKNDSHIFNYTGEAPDREDSTATRIYDSNQQRFTLKWWSTTPGHLYFPSNGWCTEFYEAGKYSEAGKIIFDALMSQGESDKKNPFIGTWQAVGMMDEMRNVKVELQRIHEEDARRNPAFRGYHILTPTYFINTTASGGSVHSITYNSKKSLSIGPTTYRITWLTGDRVAIEIHEGFHTDYEIWERTTDGVPVLNRMASVYVK
mgnify:CR=1 FL=1